MSKDRHVAGRRPPPEVMRPGVNLVPMSLLRSDGFVDKVVERLVQASENIEGLQDWTDEQLRTVARTHMRRALLETVEEVYSL